MKLKIKITGPKVHDVGYRPYLTELAMRLALRGFEVYNDDEERLQAVIALIEGDKQRITHFYNAVRKERPQLADVDNVTSEEYADDVMPLWQSALINTASQMNKAIPLLQDMRDDLKEMKGDIKEMKGDIKEMKGDIKVIRKTTDATLEEIKGMREEFQPGYASNFRQMQSDIRAIKDLLGMC